MRPDARREAIMDHLLSTHSAELETLAAICGVSKMTIHRDLDAMSEAGLLRKVRGGATLTSTTDIESSYRFRAQLALKEKDRIAAAVAAMVEPGMTLILDDGSTAYAVVEHLAPLAPLTVITASLPVAQALASHAPAIKVIVPGGSFAPRYEAFTGPLALQALAGLRADLALLSSSAIKGGTVFHQEMEIAQLKRSMLSIVDRSVLMADPSKFGRSALCVLADLSEFSTLVTTQNPPAETLAALEACACSLVLAPEEPTARSTGNVQSLNQ